MSSQPTDLLAAAKVPDSHTLVHRSCDERSIGLGEVESGDGSSVVAQSLRNAKGKRKVSTDSPLKASSKDC